MTAGGRYVPLPLPFLLLFLSRLLNSPNKDIAPDQLVDTYFRLLPSRAASPVYFLLPIGGAFCSFPFIGHEACSLPFLPRVSFFRLFPSGHRRPPQLFLFRLLNTSLFFFLESRGFPFRMVHVHVELYPDRAGPLFFLRLPPYRSPTKLHEFSRVFLFLLTPSLIRAGRATSMELFLENVKIFCFLPSVVISTPPLTKCLR